MLVCTFTEFVKTFIEGYSLGVMTPVVIFLFYVYWSSK